MTDKLATEIITGRRSIEEGGMHDAMSAAGEELRNVALALEPLALAELDLPDLAGNIMQEAAQQERLAAIHHVLSLIEQLTEARRPELPERTARGTLFKPYEASRYGQPFQGEYPVLLSGFRDDRDVNAAAIFATSHSLNRYQLARELPNATVGDPNAVITKFRRHGLILIEGESAVVREGEGIVHTRKFDGYMEAIPSWQHAVKLRILAHRIGMSEDETQTTLLKLGELMLG